MSGSLVIGSIPSLGCRRSHTLSALQLNYLKMLEYSQRPKCVPAARSTGLLHFEVCLSRMSGLKRPGTVRPAFA
jgi:hypothetical protein